MTLDTNKPMTLRGKPDHKVEFIRSFRRLPDSPETLMFLVTTPNGGQYPIERSRSGRLHAVPANVSADNAGDIVNAPERRVLYCPAGFWNNELQFGASYECLLQAHRNCPVSRDLVKFVIEGDKLISAEVVHA